MQPLFGLLAYTRNIPGMQGLECCCHRHVFLRSHFSAALSTKVDGQELARIHAYGYLNRPFNLTDLSVNSHTRRYVRSGSGVPICARSSIMQVDYFPGLFFPLLSSPSPACACN